MRFRSSVVGFFMTFAQEVTEGTERCRTSRNAGLVSVCSVTSCERDWGGVSGLGLEAALGAVLLHVRGGKHLAVHGDVHAGGQDLQGADGAADVEERVA